MILITVEFSIEAAKQTAVKAIGDHCVDGSFSSAIDVLTNYFLHVYGWNENQSRHVFLRMTEHILMKRFGGNSVEQATAIYSYLKACVQVDIYHNPLPTEEALQEVAEVKKKKMNKVFLQILFQQW